MIVHCDELLRQYVALVLLLKFAVQWWIYSKHTKRKQT